MTELIEKLGINWRLLIAQAVNFLIILAVLRFTVYKPLIRILNERRAKIVKGLEDAEASTKRLHEVEVVGKERLAAVEREAIKLVERAESGAKHIEAEILLAAKGKEAEVLRNAARLAEPKGKEAEEAFFHDAENLVRAAVTKVAHLTPDALDEALIREAVEAAKRVRK